MASAPDNGGATPQTSTRGQRTPSRRAFSVDPPSTSRRSVHTPGSLGRNLGASQRQGLSASGRKPNAATPHGRAAIRTLDSRRAAINTPGRNRRRSMRDQRETPRNWLQALGRKLAPASRPITSSSSSPRDKQADSITGAIPEDDEDDDLPIDRPRLSLPIDEDDDDSSDLQPHQSTGLEDENFTVQSIELPRRAISEQPRFSTRMSDFMGPVDLQSDDVGIDSAFFPPAQFDDDDDDGDLQGPDDVTYERIDSEAARRETMAAGRESDFGIIEVPLDANESTFFLAPQLQESPVRSPPAFDSALGGELEPVEEEQDPGDVDMEDDDDIGIEETELHTTSANLAPANARFKKPGKKVSKYGIEYPSLPVGVVKRLAQTFAQTSGVSKAKITPDTMSAIMQASDWFFAQLGDDLQAYAKHAGRKTIDESDMITLMKRQRQTSMSTTPFSLAQRHLPRELLQELRMTPPVPAKKRRANREGEDIT